MSGKHTTTCPTCGQQASGNFCHHCGSTLGGNFCNQCGAEVSGDGKFCNQCGAPSKGGAARGAGAGSAGAAAGGGARRGGASRRAEPVGAGAGVSNTLPWWFAGIAMFGLILVVGWNMVQPDSTAPAAGGQPTGGVDPNGAGTTDISQMSPRAAADALFNRVMQAAAAGDSVEAQGFMPMALQAYQMAQPLDMDGLFHLSLLQRTGFQTEEALATALQMLETEPNHILGLAAAAEAAVELGRDAEAAGYYQRILDNHDAEIARPLIEYQGHLNYFESAKTDAEAFLAGG